MVIKVRHSIFVDFNFNQCKGEEKHFRICDPFTFVFHKKDNIYFVSILSDKHFNSAYSITLSNFNLNDLEIEVDSFMTFLSYI